MNEKNPNYETIKGLTIGQVSSNPLRRLLLPNGVRLHPRHGDEEEEVEALLEAMRESKSMELTTKE